MKMVKSLLLGTAAGVVAIAGAQAADLPVKAKPVQYVKICSLYGVGFYYIPGTDMCLKVGGWVRAEYTYGDNGSMSSGNFDNNRNNRMTNDSTWRSRGYITADARNQTAYGTVRSYIAVGLNDNDINGAAPGFSSNRAFIQWAGFTFGLAQSFYDFYSVPATAYFGYYPASDTGDPGWKVLGYTAQFGNGFSATISAEMRRMTQIINNSAASSAVAGTNSMAASAGGIAAGAFAGTAGAYGGFQAPDIVGNLRLDQAWGSAQVMAAWHELNAQYYTNGIGTGEGSGHPGDSSGWAIGGGLKLNAPMIGKGDYFQAQVNYSEGALRYVMFTPAFNWGNAQGQNAAYGVLSDSVYGGVVPATNSGQQLTTGWGVNAAYEHFWNAAWRTSVYGGYAEVDYNSLANAMLCSLEGAANGAGVGTASTAKAGCNNDWNTWWIGTRTQWNVTSDFYLGVDVLYNKLESATTANGLVPAGVMANGSGTAYNVSNEDDWQVRFRVHKDFYP